MAQERDAVTLAADGNCLRCRGSGATIAFIPTEPPRFGGEPRSGVKLRVLCECVTATKGADDE